MHARSTQPRYVNGKRASATRRDSETETGSGKESARSEGQMSPYAGLGHRPHTLTHTYSLSLRHDKHTAGWREEGPRYQHWMCQGNPPSPQLPIKRARRRSDRKRTVVMWTGVCGWILRRWQPWGEV
nr:uncharacterized protein CTRU02_04595 [Colletotrichum truncatum]KAF6795785.1 hypothetical protein CTRU02_04595 [Colletotrichum truncatum]